MSMFTVLDPQTNTIQPATHTVVIAGKGHHINKHFCSLAQAEVYYEEQLKRCAEAYKLSKFAGGYQVTNTFDKPGIIQQATFQNLKKDGSVGKFRDIVRLAKLY